MATFTNYNDTLPNPNVSIAYDGSSTSTNQGYAAGPGYASVRVASKFKTMNNRTNSGVFIARSKAFHQFTVNITYNPLTEEEFTPVYSFLQEKQGMLKPFFVTLPQYDNPQDSTLANHSPILDFEVDNSLGYNAGVSQINIDAAGYDSSTDGQLRPGDFFTFTDTTNTNHTKAYKITRVETNADYTDSQPSANELRISFVPPLRKDVADNATINYRNPKMKVVAKDSQQYSLGNNNLYSFSLSLEEVQ